MKCKITRWHYPAEEFILKDEELHLWRFSLDCSEDALVALQSLLTHDEVLRGERLLDSQKKIQFIVARARLRQILSHYQNVSPSQIKFQYNHYGKPAVAESQGSLVSFNLSHSGQCGVLAVVNRIAVGIDIEKIEDDLDFIQLVDRYFDLREQRQFHQYSPQKERRGFYRLWTQKEAVLKLIGEGLLTRPSTVENKINDLHLRSFSVAPGYVCSVATEKIYTSVLRFHLPEDINP